MKSKTKKITALVLCLCVLFGFLVPGGGIRALATALNRAVRGDEVTSSTYLKSDPNARLGSEGNPFLLLEIVPTEDQAIWGYYIPDCEPVDMKKAQMLYSRYNIKKPLVDDNPIFSAKDAEDYGFYDQIPAGDFVLDGPSQDISNPGNWIDIKNIYSDYNNRGFDLEHSTADHDYGQWQIRTNKDKDGNPLYTEQGIYKLVDSGQGNFSLDEASGDYTYQPGGDYIWVPKNKITGSDTSLELVTRQDEYIFRRKYLKMTNNDAIIKKMFSAESSNFSSLVVTITPQQLQNTADADGNIPLIEEADLISIHNMQEYADLVKIYHRVNDPQNENANNGATFFNTADTDLTYDETMAIMRRMASNNPASMVIQKPLIWTPVVKEGITAEQSNFHKLLIMLLQYQPKKFMEIFGNYLTKEAFGNGSTKYDKVVYKPGYGGTIREFTNTTFACSPTNRNQNMYSEMRLLNVNSGGTDLVDHIMTTQGDPIVSQLLNDGKDIGYTTFDPNNPYGDWSNNTTSEGFEYFDKEPGDKLSLMEGLEFILQPQQYTPKLRVLEVQPCDKYIYNSDPDWEKYYQKLFPWYKPKTDVEGGWLRDSDLIEVTTMPTWEFIGSVGRYDYQAKDADGNRKLLTADSSDDLLSKYDLIIIGSKQDRSNGQDGYNRYANSHPGTDMDLGHLIYTSVGGALWNGYMDATIGDSNNNNPSEYLEMHYSGNDITLKKMLELEDFLKAGKPIVVDENLYDASGKVDITKVDRNSKLYDLLTWVDTEVVTTTDEDGKEVQEERHAEQNIFRHDNISSVKMKKLINGNLCRLMFVNDDDAYPVEYEYTKTNVNGITGVIKDEIYSVSSRLVYHFYVAGTSQAGYRAILNVDSDGDGVYAGSLKEISEVDNMQVALNENYSYDTSEPPLSLTFYATKSDMRRNKKLGTSSDFVLQPYVDYYATVDIPAERQGMVPWKLEVQEVENKYLRSSAVDYTAIYNADKESIMVLQMNLVADMNSNEERIENDIWGNNANFTTFTRKRLVVRDNSYQGYKNRKAANGGVTETDERIYNVLNSNQRRTVEKFETYLKPVKEFDVTIHYMYNSDWCKLFYTTDTNPNSSTYKQRLDDWEDFLSDYDMVVLGFIDQSSFTSNKVYAEGLKDFIAQGKGVILSHDTVSGSQIQAYNNIRVQNCYTAYATWLRTTAGQRRAFYNKRSDGTYEKSYTDTMVNGQPFTTVCQNNVNNSYWQKFYRRFSEEIDGDTIESQFYGQWSNEWIDNSTQLSIRTTEGGNRGNGTNYVQDRVPVDGRALSNSGWGDGNAWSTAFVELTNNGQITTYPYTLNPVIEVLQTHIQNYQLDLEFMETGDVNVWFNLTDRNDAEAQAQYGGINNMPNHSSANVNVYSAKDQDSRNNFYIYNKGNITYTGSGHGVGYNVGNAMMTDEEVQLFVNTMIAAYRQPASVPYVEIENADTVAANGDSLIYVDYDEQNPTSAVDGMIETINGEEMVRVEFTVNDPSAALAANITNKKYYLNTSRVAEDGTKTDSPDAIYDEGTAQEQLVRTENGSYSVKLSSDEVKYVLYVPYREVRDNNSVTVQFETYATYTKGGRKFETGKRTTNATVMLLPLFGLS